MAEHQKDTSDGILKPAVLQPPIIMKIDGPVEDTVKIENNSNEQNASVPKSDEFKMCSPSFRPSAASTNNIFTSNQNKTSRGILKPPQLNVHNVSSQSSKPFVLKPSQLNPLTNHSGNGDKNNSENCDKSQNVVNGDAPKFVPLLADVKNMQTTPTTTSNHPSSTGTSISNSSFIFGQNLEERVVANEKKLEESKASSSLNSNGSPDMLFSSALKNEVKADSSQKEKETKSLRESAREYEESRACKRKYEEVEVITGEEDENNILKISCKLFSFDKGSSSWQERGRGTLRLNDFNADANIGSRIVFRTTGSLRVILNTKIWAEMTIDKASEKSIRLTALDANGEIKVFLLMSSIEDSNKLFSHLQIRLEREISAQKRKKVPADTVPDSGGN